MASPHFEERGIAKHLGARRLVDPGSGIAPPHRLQNTNGSEPRYVPSVDREVETPTNMRLSSKVVDLVNRVI